MSGVRFSPDETGTFALTFATRFVANARGRVLVRHVLWRFVGRVTILAERRFHMPCGSMHRRCGWISLRPPFRCPFRFLESTSSLHFATPSLLARPSRRSLTRSSRPISSSVAQCTLTLPIQYILGSCFSSIRIPVYRVYRFSGEREKERERETGREIYLRFRGPC